MRGDRLNALTPDIGGDIAVADLPNDIMALFCSFQEYYSNAEKQKSEALTTAHQANLSTIDSRIGWVDDQITQLYSYREKLLSMRHQESQNVAILKSILSPIRRVPTEVLCEIFVHCLPKASNSAPLTTLNAYEAPLLLCQVCSKWRRTALAFPVLWRTLALRAGYAFHDERQFILTINPSVSLILNSWVARAGSCLLSLGFDLHEGNIESDLTLELEDVVNQLPNSRLQHLSLKVIWPSDTYFLSKISQEFTELESIFLQTNSGPDSVLAPDCLIQSAPRLRSAQLYDFIDPDIVPRHLLPWSQLTHLRVEGQLGEKMWYILICLCTNLQYGIFSIDNDSEDAPPIPTSDHNIILPHLVHLTIHVNEDGDNPGFRHLVLPAIKRLQILFEGPVSTGPFHMWTGHLPAGCSDSLNSLIIIGLIDFTRPQLESFLTSSSSVTELHLSVGTHYTDFFKALTFSTNTHPLLPKLESLHCYIQDDDDADALLQSIISFVQSRWWNERDSPLTRPVGRLRCLTLRFHDAIYEGDFMDEASQFLEPFRDEGLSLLLYTWDDKSLNLREMMNFEPE